MMRSAEVVGVDGLRFREYVESDVAASLGPRGPATILCL
jgi:hypothetical protein